MQTVIKQAICVSVLQNSCKREKRKLAFFSEVLPTLLKGSALPQKHMIKCPKNYK